jgi:DNA-directed RNA polymerase specialized sigma24 family protein
MNDLDDIRQNAILRRLRSGPSIRRDQAYTERELYRGKEYGVAVYSAKIDEIRRRSREERAMQAVKLPIERYDNDCRTRLWDIEADDPAKRATSRELVYILREEALQLPERQRSVIFCCGFGTQKISEFATEVGITERSAASLWDRAIKRLRKSSRLQRAA